MTFNQEQKVFLEDKFGMTLSEMDKDLGRYMISMFKCTKCDSWAELASVRRKNFNIDTVMCNSCQRDYFEARIPLGSNPVGGAVVLDRSVQDTNMALPTEEGK